VAISHDGRRAVTGTYQKNIRVWSVDDGRTLIDFETGPVKRNVPEIKGPITAAGWDLLGIKTHLQEGHSIGYVFIRADSSNHNTALGSAILVAQRLVNSRKLDMAKVFVMDPQYQQGAQEIRSPIARADFIAPRWGKRFVTNEKTWLLQRGFESYTNLDDVFELDVTRPPKFLDAAAEYERHCPLASQCQYGMDGW
jgi:hypothetical protein